MVLGGSQHVLPVPVSHMENVLSLQTRQIVLCCCFSPKAQPSIRRIRLPAFNIIEHFVKSNALYEFWEVFEKRLSHEEANLPLCPQRMLEQVTVQQKKQPFTQQLFFGISLCYEIISQG